jgi:hypothetical protein
MAAPSVRACWLAGTECGAVLSIQGQAARFHRGTAPASSESVPQAEALQTFTFPDGHISFAYPAGWSVRTEQGPYLDEAHRATSVVAFVAGGSGGEVVRVQSGMYGDGAAGAVKRTVLEHLPVPGITAKEPVEFGIAADEVQPQPEGGSYYFMAAGLAHQFLPTQTGSGSNQIPLGGKAGVKYPQTVAQEQLREWRRGRSSCHLAMSRIRCAWSPPNCAQSLRTSTSWTSNNSPSSTLAVR